MINSESYQSSFKEMREIVLNNKSNFKEKLKKELVDFLIDVKPNKYNIYEKINIIFDFELLKPVIVMADLNYKHELSRVGLDSLDRFYFISFFSLYEPHTNYVKSKEAKLWLKIDSEAQIFNSNSIKIKRNYEDVKQFVELKMNDIYSKIYSNFLLLNDQLEKLKENQSQSINEIYEDVWLRNLPLRLLTDNQIEKLFYMASEGFLFGKHNYFYDPNHSKSERVMTVLNKAAILRLNNNLELLKMNISYLQGVGKSLFILHECEIINNEELIYYFSKVIEITGVFFSKRFLKVNMDNSDNKIYFEYIIEIISNGKIENEKTFNTFLKFLNDLLSINSDPFIKKNEDLLKDITSKLIDNLKNSKFNINSNNFLDIEKLDWKSI